MRHWWVSKGIFEMVKIILSNCLLPFCCLPLVKYRKYDIITENGENVMIFEFLFLNSQVSCFCSLLQAESDKLLKTITSGRWSFMEWLLVHDCSCWSCSRTWSGSKTQEFVMQQSTALYTWCIWRGLVVSSWGLVVSQLAFGEPPCCLHWKPSNLSLAFLLLLSSLLIFELVRCENVILNGSLQLCNTDFPLLTERLVFITKY